MKTENEFKALENAKYATVHNCCKGGAVVLSKSVGVTQATLSNKVNVNMPPEFNS